MPSFLHATRFFVKRIIHGLCRVGHDLSCRFLPGAPVFIDNILIPDQSMHRGMIEAGAIVYQSVRAGIIFLKSSAKMII
jgi:hypothetical protein